MSSAPRAFDAYVAVDWSAASVPREGPDSIWIAALGTSIELRNLRTRSEATKWLRDCLRCFAASGLRVLLGWDFPLGFPDGFRQRLGVRGRLGVLRAVAALVRDGPDNRNGRFAAAAELNRRAGAELFWGAPAGTKAIAARRPLLALPELRQCEKWLQARGLRPHSPWKLYTAGSCGGQALTGIPRVLELRDDPELRAFSRVWPHETGFGPPVVGAAAGSSRAPLVVHAEIWPTAIGWEASAHPVRDAAQVLGAVRWMRRADARGRLARLFGVPAGIDRRTARAEGWVLAQA